jgi:hypothetical protein
MLRRVGYGVVAWVVPYVTAVALMGLMVTDRIAFQTIMIIEGALVGCWLACRYFRQVNTGFFREGVALGATWVATNWLLDFVALLPFSELTIWRYFVEIGFRYIGMFATTVAVGYVLSDRIERWTAQPIAGTKAA